MNKLNIIIHADDFGICKDVTNDIYDSIKNGCISRTSVICNTKDIEHAASIFEESITDFELSLHLNLVEGRPISELKDASILVNEIGEFKFSFLTLWISYILSSRNRRDLMKNQIKLEIENQILTYNKYFNKDSRGIHIDGHTHVHMIPFVLDIILELRQNYNIHSMRIPNERFYFSLSNLKHYLSSNLVKYCVLKILSKLQMNKIRATGIKCNDYFIGILASGMMNCSSLKAALSALKKVKKKEILVELLFHPGGVRDKQIIDWTTNFDFIYYYSDLKRKREKNVVCSSAIQEIIKPYNLIEKI